MSNKIVDEINLMFNKLEEMKKKGATDRELFEAVVYMLKTWKNDEIMQENFRKSE